MTEKNLSSILEKRCNDEPPTVDSYRFGHIVIDGQAYQKDVVILPERVVANWWRISGHRLHSDDLSMVFEAAPEVLIVGQGAVGQMQVPDETQKALEAASIKLEAMRTEEACQRYNELSQHRKVAAALHLTC